LCILFLAAAAAGYLYWDYAQHFQSTDDAFIAARQFAIAPKVSGYITAVPVSDNEHVAAGDVIARIDDRDYRIALDQAQAQVANAEAASRTSTRRSACNRRRSPPPKHRSSKPGQGNRFWLL
jgi:membrane fusion protein, multidrug efflux system